MGEGIYAVTFAEYNQNKAQLLFAALAKKFCCQAKDIVLSGAFHLEQQYCTYGMSRLEPPTL